MTKALIDADILIYEAASRCEVNIPWPHGDDGEVLWTRHAHWDEAKKRLEDSIQTVAQKAGADTFVAIVTDSSVNWRKDVFGDYKSNRKASVKPMLITPLREWVEEQPWGRCVRPLEGDDVMGILQTKPGAGDTICVTTDKDLATIPGKHYNFRKDEHFEVSVAEANWMHLLQALMGDATDGYPGCPGIGFKTAINILDRPIPDDEIAEVWDDLIVPEFVKKGLTPEYALTQAQVARILRAEDYNPKTQEVIPWVPPTPEGEV